MNTNLGATLEREHRVIDGGIEAAATEAAGVGNEHVAGVRRAIDLLRRHIYLEEEFLFPPLREVGVIGPIMVMLREHGEMWPLLEHLEAELDADDDGRAAAASCRALLSLLAVHNMKEEQIVYVSADDQLAAEVRDRLIGLLATAERPANWVCAGARSAV